MKYTLDKINGSLDTAQEKTSKPENTIETIYIYIYKNNHRKAGGKTNRISMSYEATSNDQIHM